jgi:hypothetical protein
MQSTHRVDEVRTVEALYADAWSIDMSAFRSDGPLVWLIEFRAGARGRRARPGG